MESTEYFFKIVLTGDSYTGKSSILFTYKEGKFPENPFCTIGVEFCKKVEKVDGDDVNIILWDQSGAERFRSTTIGCITRAFYRASSAVLLLYDITNEQSFKNLNYRMEDFINFADPAAILVLIGNKIDLDEDRKISYEQGHTFAQEHKMIFFETSVKEGINVNAVFKHLAEILKFKADENQIAKNYRNLMLQMQNQYQYQERQCNC